MKIETILFDFDYTLADSSQGAFKSVNYALEGMGFSNSPYTDVCKTIGLSLTDTYSFLTNREDGEEAKIFTKLFIERADQVMVDNTKIFDFVPQALSRFKSEKLRLGIVSTKFRYRIESILKRDDLIKFFDVIVGGEDVESQKPDPEGINLALSKLSVSSNNCLYVGDSRVDGELSIQGNVKFVGVCTGTTKYDDLLGFNTFSVCETLEQLPDLLFKS